MKKVIYFIDGIKFVSLCETDNDVKAYKNAYPALIEEDLTQQDLEIHNTLISLVNKKE